MISNPKTLPAPSELEASRFLAHATLGYSQADVRSVMSKGYVNWIYEQFDVPQQSSHRDWLLANRKPNPNSSNAGRRFDVVDSIWRKFIEGKDQLRQKSAFALSQIVVASAEADLGAWQQFATAHYMDILDNHAFGNYADLLKKVSLSPQMGYYLTYIGSRKAGAAGAGSQPDENYARELLQLFTLGVTELNDDGTVVLEGGKEKPSYTQEDIEQLAKVFTGWTVDTTLGLSLLHYGHVDLVNIRSNHDDSEVSLGFLSQAIVGAQAAGQRMSTAIDLICAHKNVPFFIARQMIQRMVTSNPDPGYVQRVAEAFRNDAYAYPDDPGRATGARADMRAVLIAILLDESLFDANRRRVGGVSTTQPAFGKLREPVARFVHWARAFGVRSRSGLWQIDEDDKQLGQSPMRSPSVFNFYRPGYVPPSTEMSGSSLVAPEFQITNETSVISYINFMRRAIDVGIGKNQDVAASYSAWLARAATPSKLVDDLNKLLACGQLGSSTLDAISAAVSDIPAAAASKRVKAAAMLILCSPAFLTLK